MLQPRLQEGGYILVPEWMGHPRLRMSHPGTPWFDYLAVGTGATGVPEKWSSTAKPRLKGASGPPAVEKNELPGTVVKDTASSGGRPEAPLSNSLLASSTANTSSVGSAFS